MIEFLEWFIWSLTAAIFVLFMLIILTASKGDDDER